MYNDVDLFLTSIISVCHQRAGRVVSVKVCLRTVCALCHCLPDLRVTVLVTMVPICRLKSFSYDSMWDSRCVDVFSEREVTQLHTLALQPTNVVDMSAFQKSSNLFSHTLSSNSELMIFIPLGMLDKLSLSPLTKHILGRVSSTFNFSLCSQLEMY